MSRILFLVVLMPATVLGEVGDPTIRTDHPQYAGEGAFQEIEDCVRFATSGKSSEQDKAIAMYLWLLTHQWHLMSPQDWCVPDTAQPGDYEMVVYDANRARFSFGYGLCGTVHAWNEPYWQSLGMPARRREFPGHVNSEIFYGGSWHAFDTDMAGLLFRRDGIVAGYDDITGDPTLVESVRPPLPHYPFAWPADFNAMKKGWQQVAQGGSWYSLYNGGYAAHPGIVHLRSGETFTRWYDRDHFGGPSKRRFWHNRPGGPWRNWTFFDNGPPVHDGERSNSRGSASYANGEFTYTPDIPSGRFREGLLDQTGELAFRSESPRLYSADGKPLSITFRHFSPYVVCGDPVDDANPMTGKATDGMVVEAQFVGRVAVEVSADEGQTWQVVKPDAGKPSSATTLRFDLTEHVKGRYGWRLRFLWSGNSGIDSLRFVTVTQVCQAIYPRLRPNGTLVTYRAASRGVIAVLPNFGLPESQIAVFEETSMRSSNVIYQSRAGDSRRAYETTDNKPGLVVFAINAPARLVEIRAAVRYQIRVPPPEGCDYRLDVSTDNGRTWKTFAQADIPADNEFSSGWLSGRTDVTEDTRRALVRAHFYAGGHRTGLIGVQLYGVHRVTPPQAVTLEYGWTEGNETTTHKEKIPANVSEKAFSIDTAARIEDLFVRLIAD